MREKETIFPHTSYNEYAFMHRIDSKFQESVFYKYKIFRKDCM